MLLAVLFSWPGRPEHARAAVAGAVAGRRRGALCSGLPEDRLRTGMGSWDGGGAPRAPSRRGEAPPWPAGVGHGRPPPPMAFLAGGAGMWGFGDAGGARRRGGRPRAQGRPPAWPPQASRQSCCPALRAPVLGGKSSEAEEAASVRGKRMREEKEKKERKKRKGVL